MWSALETEPTPFWYLVRLSYLHSLALKSYLTVTHWNPVTGYNTKIVIISFLIWLLLPCIQSIDQYYIYVIISFCKMRNISCLRGNHLDLKIHGRLQETLDWLMVNNFVDADNFSSRYILLYRLTLLTIHHINLTWWWWFTIFVSFGETFIKRIWKHIARKLWRQSLNENSATSKPTILWSFKTVELELSRRLLSRYYVHMMFQVWKFPATLFNFRLERSKFVNKNWKGNLLTCQIRRARDLSQWTLQLMNNETQNISTSQNNLFRMIRYSKNHNPRRCYINVNDWQASIYLHT